MTLIDDTDTDINKVLLPGAETAPDPKMLPVIEILLNDSTSYPIYRQDIDKWAALYPAVDIMQELRSMVGWADANPKKRKTKNGVKRFMNSWLAKEQDKGRNPNNPNSSSGNTGNQWEFLK